MVDLPPHSGKPAKQWWRELSQGSKQHSPGAEKALVGGRDEHGNQAGHATGSWPEATMRCPRSK